MSIRSPRPAGATYCRGTRALCLLRTFLSLHQFARYKKYGKGRGTVVLPFPFLCRVRHADGNNAA